MSAGSGPEPTPMLTALMSAIFGGGMLALGIHLLPAAIAAGIVLIAVGGFFALGAALITVVVVGVAVSGGSW